MATSARIGILLLILLVGWMFIYYQFFVAPVMQTPHEIAGLGLTERDTIGVTPNEDTVDPAINNGEGNFSSTNREVIEQPAVDQNQNGSDENGGAPFETSDSENKPPLIDDNEKPNADPVLPAPRSTTPYAVQKDDTMPSIAAEWFGDSSKWVLIAQENPLADPKFLRIGDALRLPPKDARPESISPELYAQLTRELRYVISSGDTLSGIANRFYGKPSLWSIIHRANRDKIPNPDDIPLGVEIIIPNYARPAE